MFTDDEAKTIGWDAINAALKRLYGDQEPRHFGTILGFRMGGKDPLEGISVYQQSDPPHWHYVTYGFTELYEKEWTDREINGFGFELTFRLMRGSETEPPAWPLDFLQNLARYVFGTGNAFAVGHHLNCNGPIALDTETEIRAILFAPDPQLEKIESELGKANFIQIVGITEDEELAVSSWTADGVTKMLAAKLSLLCTDLRRKSIFTETLAAEQLAEGIKNDGSSTQVLYVTKLEWNTARHVLRAKEATVSFGASQVSAIKAVLPGRLLHGKELFIQGQDAGVALIPSEGCRWEKKDRVLEIHITAEAANDLAKALIVKETTFKIPSFPTLTLCIKKSEIKDQQGRVVKVIG